MINWCCGCGRVAGRLRRFVWAFCSAVARCGDCKRGGLVGLVVWCGGSAGLAFPAGTVSGVEWCGFLSSAATASRAGNILN